jgi:histidinol-phosphate aminotransferase
MKTLKVPIHKHLGSLSIYQPGRPIEEVARELNIPFSQVVKMASNENPLGPSANAIKAMEEAIHKVHLYPDGSAYYLKKNLSERLNIAPESLIFSNGSNELIEWIGHLFFDGESNVVVSQYCFAIYPIVASMFGASTRTIPAVNHAHDLESMASAIDSKTKAVFVANPNNPTGTLASTDEILSFLNRVPDTVLIVMDEAYFEFLESPTELLPYIRDASKPNLLLMRTFSKIHGLAGLRIGYGIGHTNLIQSMEKVRQPFNVNGIAQAGAMAALKDDEHVERTRTSNRVGLGFLQSGFLQLGLQYVPSYANFVLVRVGDGERVFEFLQGKGVITRPMNGYQLPEWLRISVGTQSENKRCLEVLEQALNLK